MNDKKPDREQTENGEQPKRPICICPHCTSAPRLDRYHREEIE